MKVVTLDALDGVQGRKGLAQAPSGMLPEWIHWALMVGIVGGLAYYAFREA